MKGNTINEFIGDLLMMGGPEKEFVLKNKYYFLETSFNPSDGSYLLRIDEYNNSNPKDRLYIRSYSFPGTSFTECVKEFERAIIFDGMTIYQAEKEIEVLFG